MQLTMDRLMSHLAGSLGRVYLVHGDDELLVLETVDKIRAKARSTGFDERYSFTVEGRFNWQEPLQSLQGGSLFSSLTLLELKLNNPKLSAEAATGMVNLLKGLHSDSLLLVSAPKLDKTAMSSVWYSALAELGHVIAINTIDRNALPRWLAERLATQGQSADAESLTFIADRVEGNLLAAHQEIVKLGLLCPPGPLTQKQIHDAVLNVARFDVYQLSEALLTGDHSRYIRILEGIRQEGEAATLVVWILADDLRVIGALQKAQHQGGGLASLGREWRLWGDRQRWVEGASRRYRPRAVWDALNLVALVDRAAKGVYSQDPWLGLRQLPLVLSGQMAEI